MQRRQICLCFAVVFCGAVTWAGPDEPFQIDLSGQLSVHVEKLEALTRITETPHRMADSTAALCKVVTPKYSNNNIHEGNLDPAWCHVDVTKNAKETILSGQGTYPEGAVIVKSKLESKESPKAILYTVMRKREAGYDPENGDWEYAVLEGRFNRVLSRGRIDSCIDCHQNYKETDHVTRAYLKKK